MPSFTSITFKKTHLAFLERIANELTDNRRDPFSSDYMPLSFPNFFYQNDQRRELYKAQKVRKLSEKFFFLVNL